MAQHTPGPWRAMEYDHTREPRHTYWHIEAGRGFHNPDKTEGDGFCLSGFLSEANARLIAAAPELLEAHEPNGNPSGPDFLDWLADRLVHVYGESTSQDFVQALKRKASKARAAIARARGEG